MDSPGSSLSSLQRTLQDVHGNVVNNLQQLPSLLEQQLQPLPQHVKKVQQWWGQTPLAQALRDIRRSHQQQLHQQYRWSPMLASITLGGRKPNALFDFAMAKEEVKARLAPITVFTIANQRNEFVLVSGENNSQMGFFFFKEEDAKFLHDKIREENPRLARDSQVLAVAMDNVYEVFTTPREQTGLQGINFRFFPDMKQVGHALQLYKDAGVPTRHFIGVPVFQAEGLTVTHEANQYVPLFLCKEDLDIAVQSAYKERNATQIKMYRDRAIKYEEEYSQLLTQAKNAKDKDRAALEARAEKAKEKLDMAREKAEAVERAPLPKIEVGSFEEVTQRMTVSSGADLAAWSQVMFVAPGLLQQATSQRAIEDDKSKGKPRK